MLAGRLQNRAFPGEKGAATVCGATRASDNGAFASVAMANRPILSKIMIGVGQGMMSPSDCAGNCGISGGLTHAPQQLEAQLE